MVRWLGILVGTLRSTVRTHRELALENLALRQQLAVWKARQPRPQLTAMDRMFWVVLSRLWKSWRHSLQVVRPETVVGWHRQGFRHYWAWKSQRRCGRPAIRTELRDLIRRIRRANPLWGAPRIHGELLKLGPDGLVGDGLEVRGLLQRDPDPLIVGQGRTRATECAGAEPGQCGGGAPRGWAPSRIPPASGVSRSANNWKAQDETGA